MAKVKKVDLRRIRGLPALFCHRRCYINRIEIKVWETPFHCRTKVVYTMGKPIQKKKN